MIGFIWHAFFIECMNNDLLKSDLFKRIVIVSGVAGPVLGLGGILLATVISPEFSWTADPLSLLGTQGFPTEYVFNGSLLLTPVVVSPFGVAIWLLSDNLFEKIGGVFLAVSMVSLFFVGVFPMDYPGPYHFLAAVGFFIFLTFALVVYGYGNRRSGEGRRGLYTIGLGCVNLLGWIVWGVFASDMGLALPEIVGSVVLSVWAVWTVFSPRIQESNYWE